MHDDDNNNETDKVQSGGSVDSIWVFYITAYSVLQENAAYLKIQ